MSAVHHMRILATAASLGILVAASACGTVTATPPPETCAPACDVHATCTGTTCACDNGFTGDGVTCTDVNECATANGGCAADATCTNRPGGRDCACPAGSLGDGLTCRPVWLRQGMTAGVELDPETFGLHATMALGKIYFGPDANTALNQYFRAYDPSAGTFSAPLTLPATTQNDFCACGFTQILVGSGQFIWMFGNEGQRYDVTANRWTAVTAYTGTVERGEAAGAFESLSNTVYLIGGRGLTRTAETFNVAAGTFADEPGMFPVEVDSASAFAPPGGSVVYVAGAGTTGKGLLSHTTGSMTWTQLADAPAGARRPLGMGGFLGRIWVATDDTLQFYNPATMTWDRMVPVPVGFKYAVGDANGTYALVQAPGNVAEVWKLTNIE